MGIEPSSQTERVYQSALGGEPSGVTATDRRATVAPQTLRPGGDLRADLQRLLGDAYRIDEELGGGGMSRVFLAEERALDRQVVVKVFSPDKAETFSADRFAREVRLTAKLQQANIVPLLSAAVAGGIPDYTMPFISGRSLREVLSQGTALPISSVISILRDVGRALAFAHMHGIVHRDIKPENILLSGATAVVTDFGIAKAVEAAAATAAETNTPSRDSGCVWGRRATWRPNRLPATLPSITVPIFTVTESLVTNCSPAVHHSLSGTRRQRWSRISPSSLRTDATYGWIRLNRWPIS